MLPTKEQKDLNTDLPKSTHMSQKGDEVVKPVFNISPDYLTLVETADLNHEDFFIDNSTFEHAKFLTYKLINRAKNFIYIYAKNLKEVYYDNGIIHKALEEKLKQGIDVKIIIVDHIKNAKYDELARNYKNLQIFKLNNIKNIPNHFLLVDNTSFRLEEPHDDTAVYARATFFNKEFAALVGDVFKDLLSNSSSISVYTD